jgi:hypothetical protein
MKSSSSPRSIMRAGAGAAIAGFALLAAGSVADLRQALFSYLVAWAFAITIAIGALAFAMAGYITHAKWLIAIRRLIEAVTTTLPLLALLFLPIGAGARHIYLWAAPAPSWSPHVAEQIHSKQAYLNLPFWWARAGCFLGLWTLVAWLLRRWSLAASTESSGSRRALSGAMAPALALTFTFAAFDWMMSLDPTWTSNAFGFYVSAAGFVAASALIAILAWAARRAHAIPDQVSSAHFHAIGNILLAMTIFWAYIAFVQMMLIWIANLPAEVGWYRIRSGASWGMVALCLGLLHFAIPFIALLMRGLKRDPRALAIVAALVLVAHLLDVHWLIMPTLHPSGFRPHWLDLAAFLAVLGPCVAFSAWRFAAAPPVPLDDPELADSLRYEMT